MVESNGVIPQVSGGLGLGNQIFITCAAYVIHRKKQIPLYIPKNLKQGSNPHNKLQHDYTESIFKHFGQILNYDINDYSFRFVLHQIGYRQYPLHGHIGFELWDPSNVPSGSIIPGYFQSYEPLREYEADIRALLLRGLEEHIARVTDEVGTVKNAAFLHIRRGDYLDPGNISMLLPNSYFEYCYKQLRSANPSIDTLWIISDDIPWAKSQPCFQDIPNVKFYDNQNELDTIALMSMCTEGAICANSTFSWWGAFLGTYNYRKPVYIPKRWADDFKDAKWLNPAEWIVVKPNDYS
jgi:hypothetical protein